MNGVGTTAATKQSDEEVGWSNYGSCADHWAPGKNVLSTKRGDGRHDYLLRDVHGLPARRWHGHALPLVQSHAPATLEGALQTSSELTDKKSKDGRPVQLVNAEPY